MRTASSAVASPHRQRGKPETIWRLRSAFSRQGTSSSAPLLMSRRSNMVGTDSSNPLKAVRVNPFSCKGKRATDRLVRPFGRCGMVWHVMC